MEVQVSYKELRHTTDQVKDFLVSFWGLDKDDISIDSSINKDFGIDGDDWSLLEIELKEKLSINLEGLQFDTYFQQETAVADPIHLINWLIQMIFYIVLFQWVSVKWGDFYVTSRPQKAKLTVGDIITSKFEGRFVRRSERLFVLA
jgi:hypothetical protein